MLHIVKALNKGLRLGNRVAHYHVLFAVLWQAQGSGVVAIPRLEPLSPDLDELVRVALLRVYVRNDVVVGKLRSDSCIDLRVVMKKLVCKSGLAL